MYEQFYHLTGKPFQLSPDPRFLYLGRGHKRALAYLRYGLEKGEGFIVITGNVGTGKTTLAQALLKQYLSADTVAGKVSTTQLDPDDTLRMVAGAFGLKHKDLNKADLLQYLERFFIRVVEAGKRSLLIVDEAQNMPRQSLEELRMLSNLQHGHRPLLQVFMLAQNEFQETMNDPGMEQFRQRVIAGYHLTPLDLMETQAYVEYRLRCVEWDNDPEITGGAFEALYKHTRGIPRQINRFFDRLLVAAYLDESHRIEAELVDSVAAEMKAETGIAMTSEEQDQIKDASEAMMKEARAAADQGLTDRLSQIEEKLDLLARALKAD
ncbi:MAG: XrtA/PEP-CTERM system-associated ATPase [Gammaproteobacteria bacterium]